MTAPIPALSAEQVLALPAMPAAKDALAALNISEGTGYKLIRDGRFPIEVVEFGRAKRVRKADLLGFLGLAGPCTANEEAAPLALDARQTGGGSDKD
ncbi:helix-turn-helix domain-containing protein [Streptomyces sp. NPDC003688]